MRRPELHFDFAARYELTVLDRIERGGDLQRVLGFPDAVPLDRQREVSNGVIVAVRPAAGEPWIGVFEHGHDLPGVPRRIIGWPDQRSFCVVYRGLATLVRSDDPARNREIEC